jgi:hypothetical protein
MDEYSNLVSMALISFQMIQKHLQTTSEALVNIMNSQSSNIPSNGSETPICKTPGDWWCKWMALKGTNFRHITLPSADLRNKLVVITGGNSGIGREAALQFAKWGADIILGCREPPPHEMHPSVVVEECKRDARAAGYDKSNVEWFSVDMAELKTVEIFGKHLLENGRPIDILVNNAGIAGSSGPPKLSGDGFEILHQVSTSQLCVRVIEFDFISR